MNIKEQITVEHLKKEFVESMLVEEERMRNKERHIKFSGNRCPERDVCTWGDICGCGYAFERVHKDYITPYLPLFVTSATEAGYNWCTVKED